MTTVLYDFSGGMESAAMIAVERERILSTGAIVRLAHTGMQIPEFDLSLVQVSEQMGLPIVVVPRRITFEEFLFERGGMVRKGTTDCSRRMKRGNLKRHMLTFPKPYEINLGFHAGETERAEEFSDRNDRPWLMFRYPLIEKGIARADTWSICETAGFTILVDAYKKMGRFDCFFCGNQSPKQALKLARHYPELAAEWEAMEERKGHSFMPIPLKLLRTTQRVGLFDDTNTVGCSCFGGSESIHDGDE